jgi:hypothetical protein
MAKYTGLLARLVVISVLIVAGVLASNLVGVTKADGNAASGNEEYMVIGRNNTSDEVFSNADRLAQLLNDYAKQGWKVRAAATLGNYNIILARPASGSASDN